MGVGQGGALATVTQGASLNGKHGELSNDSSNTSMFGSQIWFFAVPAKASIHLA